MSSAGSLTDFPEKTKPRKEDGRQNSSHFWQIFYLIPIIISFHYCKIHLWNNFKYYNPPQTHLDVVDVTENQCKLIIYEMVLLRKEIQDIKEQLEEMRNWRQELPENIENKVADALDTFYSDHIGMFDYASEYSGGSLDSTPDTIPYPSKVFLRFFGTFDWLLDSQPNVIIQPTTAPNKCFAFYGNKGRIRIKLPHPIILTHITLEHIRIGKDSSSAPKKFQIFGVTRREETNLGDFTYDLNDKIIQTFQLKAKNYTFELVELRILSNYGNDVFTCVYRFRVHSIIN